MYDIPNRLLVNHAVSGLDGYLKSANLRSPLDL
jgi:nicotinate dehydrogenase subunit B